MKSLISLGSLVLLGICASVSSQAATYTWNFDVPAGAVGSSSHTYQNTTNAYNLIAHGYKNNGDGSELYGKSDGAGETGLGLSSDGDHEIDNAHFIQLDVSDLKNHGLSNLTMLVGSVQSGEGFKIYGSNTAGSLGTLLVTGDGSGGVVQSILVPSYSTYQYFSLTASSANVLLENGLTASSVPEPAFFQLASLLGLGGLSAFRLRRKLSA